MPLFLGSHWWPLYLFPGLTALALLVLWWWRGRDQTATLPTKSSFLPPFDLSPAQIGTLDDNSCDTFDVVATLVDLAARGFFRIEEVGQRDFFLLHGDLRFRKSNRSWERLKKHERLVLEALFDPQPPDIEAGQRPTNENLQTDFWEETALSLLQNKFYRHLAPIRAEVTASLVRGGYFPSNHGQLSALVTTVGTLLIFCGFQLYRADNRAHSDAFESGLIAFPLGIVASGALWFWSARYMSPKSGIGTHNAQAAWRFAEWVKTVQPKTLETLLSRQPELFERLLPYAIVLRVGGIWASKGAACGAKTPGWFISPLNEGAGGEGAAQNLARLGAHLGPIEATLSSSPPQKRRSDE